MFRGCLNVQTVHIKYEKSIKIYDAMTTDVLYNIHVYYILFIVLILCDYVVRKRFELKRKKYV